MYVVSRVFVDTCCPVPAFDPGSFSATFRFVAGALAWPIGWRSLNGPQKGPTPTPPDTFGMSWDADCEPDLITQTTPGLANAFVAEWEEKRVGPEERRQQVNAHIRV